MAEPEQLAPGVFAGDPSERGQVPVVPVPVRVRWKTLNVWGWQECQTCGFVAATLNGMARHELYEHSDAEGYREIVADLEHRVYSAHGVLDQLPVRAGLRLFPWRRRR